MGIERHSRDELPFKKSIDNAFQGRDEQTHKWAFAVTECKENRTLHEKSRFAGAKRFALRPEKRKGLRAKSTINNCRAGAPLKERIPPLRASFSWGRRKTARLIELPRVRARSE